MTREERREKNADIDYSTTVEVNSTNTNPYTGAKRVPDKLIDLDGADSNKEAVKKYQANTLFGAIGTKSQMKPRK